MNSLLTLAIVLVCLGQCPDDDTCVPVDGPIAAWDLIPDATQPSNGPAYARRPLALPRVLQTADAPALMDRPFQDDPVKLPSPENWKWADDLEEFLDQSAVVIDDVEFSNRRVLGDFAHDLPYIRRELMSRQSLASDYTIRRQATGADVFRQLRQVQVYRRLPQLAQQQILTARLLSGEADNWQGPVPYAGWLRAVITVVLPSAPRHEVTVQSLDDILDRTAEKWQDLPIIENRRLAPDFGGLWFGRSRLSEWELDVGYPTFGEYVLTMSGVLDDLRTSKQTVRPDDPPTIRIPAPQVLHALPRPAILATDETQDWCCCDFCRWIFYMYEHR